MLVLISTGAHFCKGIGSPLQGTHESGDMCIYLPNESLSTEQVLAMLDAARLQVELGLDRGMTVVRA